MHTSSVVRAGVVAVVAAAAAWVGLLRLRATGVRPLLLLLWPAALLLFLLLPLLPLSRPPGPVGLRLRLR
jgi:hypothetical protein